jgi:hypothetical protein
VRFPAAIAREALFHDNQTVELKVVADGLHAHGRRSHRSDGLGSDRTDVIE